MHFFPSMHLYTKSVLSFQIVHMTIYNPPPKKNAVIVYDEEEDFNMSEKNNWSYIITDKLSEKRKIYGRLIKS